MPALSQNVEHSASHDVREMFHVKHAISKRETERAKRESHADMKCRLIAMSARLLKCRQSHIVAEPPDEQPLPPEAMTI
jgi:hypothetical protein